MPSTGKGCGLGILALAKILECDSGLLPERMDLRTSLHCFSPGSPKLTLVSFVDLSRQPMLLAIVSILRDEEKLVQLQGRLLLDQCILLFYSGRIGMSSSYAGKTALYKMRASA